MSLFQSTLRLLAGSLLLTGCMLETSARPGAAAKTTADAGWMPPGAAVGSHTSASAARDGGGDVTATEATQVDSRDSDAGDSPKPAARNDAGSAEPRDKDAGAKVTKPATRPMQPAMPDASTGPVAHSMPTMPAMQTMQKPVRCKPGIYTGTFTGSIQLAGLSLSSVTGTVRAEMTLDAAAAHLVFDGAKVMGVDQDGNRLTVELSGKVNCADNRLEDGRLKNGNFRNIDADSDTAFTGAAEATYSQEPYSLIGTFTVEAQETALLGGRGTWSVLLSE